MMKRVIHYSWPILLAVAAVLAPDVATAITLLVLAVTFAVLVLMRNKSLTHIMEELSGLIAGRGMAQPTSSTLDRNLLRFHRHLLLLAALAEMIVFLCSITGGLDITVARNYALLILVALAPLGLEAELTVLVRGRRKRSSESVQTAFSYAAEDIYGVLGVLALSLIGTLWLHIPPALAALQILVITAVTRPILSGSALQTTPHRTERRWRIFFMIAMVYGSFIFFFIRHYLEPRYADVINPITWQATTVALFTFIVCQAVLVMFSPKAPKVVAYRLSLLLALLLGIAYIPFLQTYLMTASLDAADWVWVILSGLIYTALCLLQYHSKQHSRAVVLSLNK